MNFGGGSNPPWARQSGTAGGYGFNPANHFASQQNIGQPGLAMPTSLSASSAGAAAYSSRSAAQPSGATAAAGAVKQRVFSGTITKVSDNFGFVDEDVFFQTSVCKGGVPKLGDRVLVEATFNANMPFKWNATRIQLIPGGQQPAAPPQQQQQVFQQQVNAVQQLNALQQAHLSGQSITPVLNQGLGLQHQMHHMAAQHQHQQHSRTNFSSIPPPALHKPPALMSATTGNRTSRFDQRDRRGDDRRNERQRTPPTRRRSRSPLPRRRSRSPKARSRSRSPKRKQRTAPRYSVTISPLSLDTKACTVLDVKNRYSNMYVPSDFYRLSLDWTQAFPLHRPFTLGNQAKFHICHRDVDPLTPFPENIDPADADYTYCAKVMLLAQPSMQDIYKQCCSLAEDSKEDEFIHPTRLLQFLVGMRAKNEPLAIGGPWSPSLDGEDPANNPQVLIKTAIRTTKALTGVDLSACTQWYRFVDISYLRAEEVHKGKTIAEHTEHVVIFLPDIWSVVPATMDYLSLQASYKRSLLIKLGQEEAPKPSVETPAEPPVTPAVAAAEPSETSQSQEKLDEEEADTSMEAAEEAEVSEKPEPTHWSKLDPKTMKVIDLRTELEARNQSCKGLKSQLQAKLSKILKVEMEAEEENEAKETLETERKEESEKSDIAAAVAKEEKVEEAEVPAPVELTKEEKEKKAREFERLKAHLEKHYVLPEEPVIPVHPNRAAKNGKFDCSVMSLSVLLDYRPEDNKEHSFEVSLFAESFNEMLMRDFGFTVYKKLNSIPEKEEPAKKPEDGASGDKKAEDGGESEKAKDRERSEDKTYEKSDGKKKGDREKSSEPESKKRRRDEDDDDDKSSLNGSTSAKKKVDAERRKWLTVDKAALLAFVYYDTTHTGYLVDKDLEDMFLTLGLQASRAQVRSLVQKACTSRETMHYRKLTDQAESPAEDQAPELEIDVIQLAKGNAQSTEEGESSGSSGHSEGVVMYKGAVLELDKVMDKLDRSEASRLAVEKEMRSLQEQTDSLKNKLEKSEEKLKKLTTDFKRTSDKLSSTKLERNRREDEVVSLRDVLKTTSRELHKVVKLVDNTMKTEEKESKPSSGSDRYTPSRENTRGSVEPGLSATNGASSPSTTASGEPETAESKTSRSFRPDDSSIKEEVVDEKMTDSSKDVAQ